MKLIKTSGNNVTEGGEAMLILRNYMLWQIDTTSKICSFFQLAKVIAITFF